MNFNSRPSSNQLNSFLGMPSDTGMHSVAGSHPMGNNFDVNTGAYSGPRGGEAAGASVTGPQGNTYAAGAAMGPHGGVAAGEGVEGAGGGYAARGAAAGPGGRTVAGSTIGRPGGASASRAAAVGPGGAAAGFGYASPSGQYTNAAAIRNNFNGYGLYNQGWYGAHPGAWYAAGWASDNAWNAATWPAIGSWFGYDGYGTEPISYDYGSDVTYDGNDVYVNGQDVGTSDDYYQQAQNLATNGAQAQPAADDQWMPLGVFAVSQSGQNEQLATLQLAVDKSAVVRGNYTDTASNKTQQIQGSVDKKTQRIAFTIGDDKKSVIETGLYNLTKDQATALVHDGKDSTQQWLLVRVQLSDQTADSGQQSP